MFLNDEFKRDRFVVLLDLVYKNVSIVPDIRKYIWWPVADTCDDINLKFGTVLRIIMDCKLYNSVFTSEVKL